MNNNLGKITNIEGNVVTVKIDLSVLNFGNLMNIHTIFDDGKKKLVGEILKVDIEYLKIGIVGEIAQGIFIPGITLKPSFSSIVRIISKEELALILGEQEIVDNQVYLGKSSVYTNYKINVDVNQFFSNHFAILGNTGSGKSCTFSRIVQNIFTTSKYLPLNANIFIFDAYGEYKKAFSFLHEFNPKLNFKSYTTNTQYPDSDILKIPLWLLDVDDIALLLGATESAQLPIIEKALKLVPILKDTSEESLKCKNDIIARALLDILKSGKDSIKIRDQITAVLTTFNTDLLNLESQIIQPGYVRTLKQCIYVDNSGKMQEMELVVNFISTFVMEGFELPNPKGNVAYDLKDLENALDFSLISEGILKSDKVFDYANILSVRLHTLASGDYAEYFKYDKMVSKGGYISELLTTFDGQKAQLIDFNINYVDDRIAKVITKIISRLLFDYSVNNDTRGKFPFHIIIEEAHRYVQNDIDSELLGYNIFDRITKEGRKYGVLLGLITQRPSELSETSISQCSNFLVLRTLHPKDLQYIKEMVPNVSDEVLAILKTLQPGCAIAFGSAFKVPVSLKMDKPDPEPYSSNCDVAKIWYAL
ncbi:MAG: ATP-binding protein [Bacilli bacterium]|nr:ATP-binding protein [Bacilli bacterium]